MRALLFILTLAFINHATSAALISFDPKKTKEYFEVINREIIDDQREAENINLARSRITAIPRPFINSTNIRSVSLADNQIQHIPADAFNSVPNLLYLNLSGNGIPNWNLFTFGHEKLRRLILSYQTVQQYPDGEINRIVHTNVLPPDVRVSFPSLEYLDLSGNKFYNLPFYFNESFPRLTHLYLVGRSIGDISDQFFQTIPSTLKSLYLDRNNIRRVYFADLGNIEVLSLNKNIYLNSIEYLNGPNLKALFLSSCNLKSINVSAFSNVVQLISLDLSKNLISSVPTVAFSPLESLQGLDMSYNRLMIFPDLTSFRNLRSLLLSNNYITSITDTIRLPSLKTLSLQGNRISTITANAFANLQNLEELDLSRNHLVSLPENWMSGMQWLRYLNLKFNHFPSIIDMSISDSLEGLELYVKSEILTSIETKHLQLLPDRYTVHVI